MRTFPTGRTGRFLEVSGKVRRTSATLRVAGEPLDPDEIARLLRQPPTHVHHSDPAARDPQTRQRSVWLLRSPLPEHTPLDERLQHLMAMLPDDPRVWRALTAAYEVDVFCGLFVDDFLRSDALTPATLALLGERGVKLSLDIHYVPQVRPGP